MNPGILLAFGAYLCWGLFPLYWKPLHHIPALEILSHRVVWSMAFLCIVLTVQRHWQWLPRALSDRRQLLSFATSALLLSVNWFIYIWAVNAGYVVEASLGYFINPLVSVVLGGIFLHERLRPIQQFAIALAALGVAYLTWQLGKPPWIALSLALTFGTYGLMRKMARLNSLEGLSLETGLIFLPALAYLLYLQFTGSGHFGHVNALSNTMLVGAGLVTALPLLMFAAGARQLPLATMGIMQYLSPSIQFGLGVFLYKEVFDQARLLGFALIWGALIVFTLESWLRLRRLRQTLPASAPLG